MQNLLILLKVLSLLKNFHQLILMEKDDQLPPRYSACDKLSDVNSWTSNSQSRALRAVVISFPLAVFLWPARCVKMTHLYFSAAPARKYKLH